MELAQSARTDSRGRMRLRSDANMFWGFVCAWSVLGLAALVNNKTGLTGTDPLTPLQAVEFAAGLFAFSIAVLVVLARSHVTLQDGTLTIRNPLRRYDLALAAAQSLEPGFWGFPNLQVHNEQTIRVMGLEESTKDRMEGGLEDAAILRNVIAAVSAEDRTHADARVTKSWAVMDRSLAFLLIGWLAYALSFAVL